MSHSRATYAKIHIAKKELGLSEDNYRDILAFNFDGAESSKDLTSKQIEQLLDIFEAKGWKGKKGNGRNFIKIKPGPAAKQQRKVLAMWNALGYDLDKLHARCKKQFDVARIEWLTDHNSLHILITDLKKRLNNKGIDNE